VSDSGLRVLVCGGRRYRNSGAVWGKLNVLHATKGIAAIIQGGASGADMLAEKWAASNDIPCMTFKADWNEYGPAAGPIRNQAMLVRGKPDVVIAFPGGKGTADMVWQATAAGVPVEVATDTPVTRSGRLLSSNPKDAV
jgi:predicted Rossmann-fold nucleotide-binding protein